MAGACGGGSAERSDGVMTVEIGGVGSDSRKTAVKKYFTPAPDPRDEVRAERLLRLSAAAGLVSLASVAGGLWFGGLWFVVGAVGLVAAGLVAAQGVQQKAAYRRQWDRAEPKPSDSQMDMLLRDDISRAANRAMQRLGLTRDELELHSRDVDPLALEGKPRLAEQGRGPITVFGPADGAFAADGIDRKLRFTAYRIMAICPTGHHLGIYECVLDMKSGRRRNEETHEYHYTDVVAVATMTRDSGEVGIRIEDLAGVRSANFGRTLLRTFEVIVSSGDRSSIVVGIRDEDEDGDTFRLQESGIDSVIEAVRRMLREKKGGAVSSM